MRILVADDHAVVRRGVIQILTRDFAQAEFGEACNAQETLTRVWDEKWDVLILDISLPGRSGLEVLHDVKRTVPKLPILVLSMHPEDQFAVRLMKSGAAGYLTKESAPEELVEAVKKVLSGRPYISPALGEIMAAYLARSGPQSLHEQLSDREYQILRLIASGKTVGAIAQSLSLSVKTISTYRKRVLEKMGFKNNAELTHYAIQNRLVD
jgi:two-component system invasion response regulator UvrY